MSDLDFNLQERRQYVQAFRTVPSFTQVSNALDDNIVCPRTADNTVTTAASVLIRTSADRMLQASRYA